MTTMYVFRDLDLNRDGVFQQNEADAFKATLDAKLRTQLRNLTGDNDKFDTAEEFEEARQAGYDISTIYKDKIIPVSSDGLNDTELKKQEDTSRTDKEYLLGQGDRKSAYDDDENKPANSISGGILEDANEQTGFFSFFKSKAYSIDTVINDIYKKSVGKVVGKSLSDKAAFDTDSRVLITQAEHDNYETFRKYATRQADGSYLLTKEDAQRLIASFKLAGDNLPGGVLNPQSQQGLMKVSGIYCGKNPGETCAALDSKRTVVDMGNGKPVTSWRFYEFFSKV